MPKQATAPEGETKAQKFVRLAQPRVNKALKALKQIENLASPGYEHTPDQITKIMNALGNQLNAIDAKFKGAKPAAEGFTL